MERGSSAGIVIIFLLTLIAFNLFVLDIAVFTNKGGQFTNIAAFTQTLPTAVPSPSSGNSPSNIALSCPQSCADLIKTATSSSLRIGAIAENEINQPAYVPAPEPKEYYIPLGSGSTNKNEWEDITATETVFDTGNYGTIREAYFVVSLRNPTQNGQVEAQLYNVTDKHPVWGSDVIMNGPASQTITSGKLSIDRGNKLYRVRMKSSLGVLAYLDNAKVRLLTD